MRGKHPLILTSMLTGKPRYYVTRAWKVRDLDFPNKPMAQIEVTGLKFDVTDQIETIVEERLAQERSQTE